MVVRTPLPPPEHDGPAIAPWRDALETWWVSLALLAPIAYCLWGYATGTYILFDHVSLLMHEAGHFFFRPFGWVLYLMGGSVFQLVLPSLFIWTALKTESQGGVQLSLAWLGQNACNVSTYIADAQERALPLITGDPKTHDWWQLLREADLLAYDDMIAHGVLVIGLVAFILALVAPRRLR